MTQHSSPDTPGSSPRSETAFPDRLERRRLLTLFGRKAVLEALEDTTLDSRTLHLASSNREGGILRQIEAAAARRGVAVREHSREALARISRHGRQDQGVALDVFCPAMEDLSAALAALPARDASNNPPLRYLALDGVTNPQNMGMAIRSVAAAGMDGILYADRGNPALGPLVIKASTGTVFRAPLRRCARVIDGIRELLDHGFELYRLDARGEQSLFELTPGQRAVFVLGGETDGIGEAVRALPGTDLHIPMAHGVESLNVAVSAALVAYQGSR